MRARGQPTAGRNRAAIWIGIALLLTSCVVERPAIQAPGSTVQTATTINQLLPADVADRTGWARDLFDAFTALDIAPTREHVCAVIAVTQQESGFRVNPVVPGLGAMAWREIDSRAAHAGIPVSVVHDVLRLKSSTGRSYADRIEAAHTEADLSNIFEDFTGSIPLGQRLFANWNPIRTRGPMQVSVVFARKFAAIKPYPYPVRTRIADELFTRRGSVYFGTAHLLGYVAPYDRYLYRFADYNAGQYASRNAAFQNALAIASGRQIVPDGALLPADADTSHPGSTEQAARSLAGQLHLNAQEIHRQLQTAGNEGFGNSTLYARVFALAQRRAGHPLPSAAVPRIQLHGPKITRHLTTQWYAQRVDGRFERCLNQ